MCLFPRARLSAVTKLLQHKPFNPPRPSVWISDLSVSGVVLLLALFAGCCAHPHTNAQCAPGCDLTLTSAEEGTRVLELMELKYWWTPT